MSSSRVRFSLHISAHRGEERRAEKEAEGVKKPKKMQGDEEGWNRVVGGGGTGDEEKGERGKNGKTRMERKIHLPFTSEYGLNIWFKKYKDVL